eukprot:6179290-Pleurochrysis_carterae.AAC.1
MLQAWEKYPLKIKNAHSIIHLAFKCGGLPPSCKKPPPPTPKPKPQQPPAPKPTRQPRATQAAGGKGKPIALLDDENDENDDDEESAAGATLRRRPPVASANPAAVGRSAAGRALVAPKQNEQA